MSYKALLIDIDDTLLDFRYGERFSLIPVFEYYKIPYTEENIAKYASINLDYWKKHELGFVSHQEVLDLRWVDFFKHFGKKANPDEVNDIYMKSLANVAYLMPNAKEFLEKASKSYDIYYISNGEPYVQYPRLKHAGIDSYPKMIFLSDEIGIAKPKIGFYDIVFDKTGLKPEDCLVLGDSLTSDIQGAKNANIDFVWYNPKHKENIDKVRQISDLLELFELNIL